MLRAVVGLVGSSWTAVSLSAAPQATAPPRLTELTLEQLGEVRITSVSKQPDEVWRTPVAIHVITAEEIRRSGATSIPEVLRLAPGLVPGFRLAEPADQCRGQRCRPI